MSSSVGPEQFRRQQQKCLNSMLVTWSQLYFQRQPSVDVNPFKISNNTIYSEMKCNFTDFKRLSIFYLQIEI